MSKSRHNTTKQHKPGQPIMPVEELAEKLGLSRQSTYAGLNAGQIPSHRVGKRFIVSREAIDEWLRKSGRSDDA